MKKHMFNVRKDSYNDYAPSNLLNVSTDAKNKMPNITAKDTINRDHSTQLISINNHDPIGSKSLAPNSPEEKEVKYQILKGKNNLVKSTDGLPNTGIQELLNKGYKIKIGKSKPIDETLVGSFLLSSKLKDKHRRNKSRFWGGIRIPIEKDFFKRQKDDVTRWNECRDGVFFKLGER